jgi:hypothetical protein
MRAGGCRLPRTEEVGERRRLHPACGARWAHACGPEEGVGGMKKTQAPVRATTGESRSRAGLALWVRG